LRTASCCSGLRLERRSKPRSYRRPRYRDDGRQSSRPPIPSCQERASLGVGGWELGVGSSLSYSTVTDLARFLG
jgi:hypothetical protein